MSGATAWHSEHVVVGTLGTIRAFVELRRMLALKVGLARRLAAVETKYDAYGNWVDVFLVR